MIPLSPTIVATIGGIPIDTHGRAVFDSGKMWYTGLYAAGRSAFTGMHGGHPLPGNLMLEELVTGSEAGKNAAEWASTSLFGGATRMEEELSEAQSRVDALFSSEGSPVGHAAKALSTAMRIIEGNSDQSSLAVVQASINEISASGIRVTDPSRRMNTELVSALHLEGLLAIAGAISSQEEEE